MRVRYSAISGDPSSSARLKELALKILEHVDRAKRTFSYESGLATGGSGEVRDISREVDGLLAAGRHHIEQREWGQADAALQKAHELQIDSARVLANLGWARLHNPDVELEVRTEEGMDFLLLAEQFDINDPDGQYYLAQVLLASNKLEAAEVRADRALKAQPDEPARPALLEKIRAKLAQQEGAQR